MYKSDDAQYKKKADPAFSGIVKLASLLQKALDTGRSSYIEMNEVSRYLGYYVKTQVEDSVRYMDFILNNYRDDNYFRHLRRNLLKLFGVLGDVALNGYEKLVSPNGSINKNTLEELIYIDSEITNAMKVIKNALMSAKNNGEVTDHDLTEIEGIAKELGKNIGERTSLVG